MRYSRTWAILACLAVAACEDDCDGTTDVDTKHIVVTGTVRIMGQPAPGVTVQLTSLGGPLTSTETDTDGRYRLEYTYTAVLPVNASVYAVGRPGIGFRDNPRLLKDTRASGIDFESIVAPSLTGAVTWNGAGVPGVGINVLGVVTATGLPVVHFVTTDASGMYAIADLIAGVYRLVPVTDALPAGAVVLPGVNTVHATEGPYTADFVVEFQSGPLEGRVSANGAGLPGITVDVAGDWPATTTTDGSGSFAFPDFPAGTHTVSISGFDPAVYVFSATSLTVTKTAAQTARADFEATVTVSNTPPVVAIVAPQDGSRHAFGTAIQFSGTATDAEDGALSGPSVTWSSDLQGALGTGTGPLADLIEGTHVVTLTATDTDGESASASISVEVVQNQPPTVSIAQPAAMAILTQGQPFTFVGSGSDPEDGALTGTALRWTSDKEGGIGSGETVTSTLNVTGFHNITLTGTDSLGASASTTVRIYVQPN